MQVCLAVTCHLYFWQNGQNIGGRGGGGRYQHKSQHRKLTGEEILPPGLEPLTVWSWVQCFIYGVIPAPTHKYIIFGFKSGFCFLLWAVIWLLWSIKNDYCFYMCCSWRFLVMGVSFCVMQEKKEKKEKKKMKRQHSSSSNSSEGDRNRKQEAKKKKKRLHSSSSDRSDREQHKKHVSLNYFVSVYFV